MEGTTGFIFIASAFQPFQIHRKKRDKITVEVIQDNLFVHCPSISMETHRPT